MRIGSAKRWHGRLRDINAVVLRSVGKHETELLRLLDRTSYETAELRQLVRTSPFIHALFVLDPAGNRLHPPPDGPLTENEREFLERSGQIWRDKQAFYLSSEAGGKSSSHGWYTWYWGNGANLLFWVRDASGRVIGAECDRSRVLADIVGDLPNSDPTDPTCNEDASRYRAATVSRSTNGESTSLHKAKSLACGWISTRRSMHGASSTLLLPRRVAARWVRGILFNLAAGIGAMVLALIGLAFYFYRESTREMREAAERVSFVNQVSHELKTPLTNIRMYAELLEQKPSRWRPEGHATPRCDRLREPATQPPHRQRAHVCPKAERQLTLHSTPGNVDAVHPIRDRSLQGCPGVQRRSDRIHSRS